MNLIIFFSTKAPGAWLINEKAGRRAARPAERLN
jgi:hypothetical protein